MAIPIGQLETYLLTIALKKGKKQLSPEDKAIVDALKKMGITELSDELLKAIDTGDYSKVLTLAKATIYATTSNFLVASTGISKGPLSKWLGMAMDALSEPNADQRNEKLRAIMTSVKSEDPELADAIDRFIKGKVDAIAILAARRVGADPKLVDIAQKAAQGDIPGTLAATGTYAGMTPSQTSAISAAYRIYTDKKITQQTVDEVAKFVGGEIPDWKSSKQDIQAAYSLGVNVDNFIKAVNSGPSGFAMPKSIEDAKDRQDALIKRKTEMTAMMAGQQVAILAAVGTLLGGAALGAVVVAFGAIYTVVVVAMGELQNWLGKELGFTGNKDEDVAYGKAERQKLIDRGLIPPSLDILGAETPKAGGYAYDCLNSQIPPQHRIFRGDTPAKWSQHYAAIGRATLEYLDGIKQFDKVAEVAALMTQCALEGYGGPFTSPVVTRTSLLLAAQVIALKYGVPSDVPLLAFSDNLTAPACSKKNEDGYGVPCITIVERKAVVGGKEVTLNVNILSHIGSDAKAPEYFTEALAWAKTLPEAEQYPGPNILADIARADGGFHIFDPLGIEMIVDNNRFYHKYGNSDETRDGWCVNAHYSTTLWGEVVYRLQQAAKVYQEITTKNKGPYGSRQQIGAQIGLYMDTHPQATFNDAVKACIADADKNLSEVLKKLKEMGLEPTNLSFYFRQIKALIATGRCKDKTQAIVAIETAAGHPVPAPGSSTYASWLQQKNLEVEMSTAQAAASKSKVASAPATTTTKVLTVGGAATVGFYLGGPIGAAAGAAVGFLYNLFK